MLPCSITLPGIVIPALNVCNAVHVFAVPNCDAPDGPVAPVAPAAPAAPAGPVSPVSPLSPLSPFKPWIPCGPCGPAGPGWFCTVSICACIVDI